MISALTAGREATIPTLTKVHSLNGSLLCVPAFCHFFERILHRLYYRSAAEVGVVSQIVTKPRAGT